MSQQLNKKNPRKYLKQKKILKKKEGLLQVENLLSFLRINT